MIRDATTVESDLSRVSGALRALSGLLHSTNGIEIWKPDDLGYLVACIASDAERAQAGAVGLIYAEREVNSSIEKLRSIRTA